MTDGRLGAEDEPIQNGLDLLADRIVEDLKCDLSLLSFAHNDKLVSLGLSSSTGQRAEMRVHEPEHLICLRTIRSDRIVALQDARSEPDFLDNRHVSDGSVVAYLGVPIHNAELGAVGAVCAINRQPHKWSDADRYYLQSVALSVENLVLRRMHRLEADETGQVLGKHDDVIMAFSLVRADPTSIHDRTGRLVYSNKALSDHVPEHELNTPKMRMALGRNRGTSSFAFRTTVGLGFRVEHRETGSGYHVCGWHLDLSRLN